MIAERGSVSIRRRSIEIQALAWLRLLLLCVAAFVALFIYNVVKVGP
jgi:hypothetical protein